MSAANTTPALSMDAGVEISLRIGQRVRHHDFHGKRVTGVVRGLSVDSEELIAALLDAARAAEDILGRQKWISGSTDPEAVARSTDLRS